MKYIVNTDYLNIGAAAAIVRALEHHYGEPCLRFVERELAESGFTIDLVEGSEEDADPTWFARAIEED